MKMQYQTPFQVYKLIMKGTWPYRGKDKAKIAEYQLRDRALGCLLYLSSGRINEVLRLTRDQFAVDDVDKDFMVIHSFYVSKRKEGREHPTPDIPLPRVGRLQGFTSIIEQYLATLQPDEKLFSFSTSRALAIIDAITRAPEGPRYQQVKDEKGKARWIKVGLFNHWFRAQSFSYQVNLIRSTIAVAKQRGIENPSTLAHYYTGSWRENAADLKK